MAREDIPAAVFGHIPGIRIGKWWPTRKEICADHVHPLPIHGIYGRQEDGARSVVLSGKSEFQDEDQGDTLMYIGSGGRAPGVRFGPQTENQNWDNSSNEALRKSALLRRPVRVIRGRGGSKFAPYDGYRYDGLYLVSNPRIEIGSEGYEVCKFNFRRMANQDPLPLDRGPQDRSGIVERRRQYWQAKQAEDSVDSGDDSVTSSPAPDGAAGGIGGPVREVDDGDEDTDELEALFSTRNEAEDALLPVHDLLAKFSRTGESITEKIKRRKLQLKIGRHIKAFAQEKSTQGEDAAQWRKELWTFVRKSVPRASPTITAEKLEQYYERLERREQERKGLTFKGTASNPIVIT